MANLTFKKKKTSGNWTSWTEDGIIVVSADVAKSATEAADYVKKNKGNIIDGGNILYGFDLGETIDMGATFKIKAFRTTTPKIEIVIE
jgi:hypothetical protein